MTAPEIPVDKLEPWTFEDLFELPESLWRFEIIDGVSPGSVSNDRILKPAKYAAAGIPAYWRVETKPQTSLTAYALADDATVYAEVGMWAVGETAHITQPFEVHIPIADLES